MKFKDYPMTILDLVQDTIPGSDIDHNTTIKRAIKCLKRHQLACFTFQLPKKVIETQEVIDVLTMLKWAK